MNENKFEIRVTHNGEEKLLPVGRKECLLDTLRHVSFFSVKLGCDTGDCGEGKQSTALSSGR